MYQAVFQRYETKYLLSDAQYAAILDALSGRMALDHYGHTLIENIYLDTPDFRLIRRSLEKPEYKEKLRLRHYGGTPEEATFVEIKKKYRRLVSKRRLQFPCDAAVAWLCGDGSAPEDTQIAREIAYCRHCYRPLVPAMLLSYGRDAYCDPNGSDLRVTFDTRALFRQTDITFRLPPGGAELLPPGMTLMEVKTSLGYPPWLREALSRSGVYPVSFSKYGRAYQMIMRQKGRTTHA